MNSYSYVRTVSLREALDPLLQDLLLNNSDTEQRRAAEQRRAVYTIALRDPRSTKYISMKPDFQDATKMRHVVDFNDVRSLRDAVYEILPPDLTATISNPYISQQKLRKSHTLARILAEEVLVDEFNGDRSRKISKMEDILERSKYAYLNAKKISNEFGVEWYIPKEKKEVFFKRFGPVLKSL